MYQMTEDQAHSTPEGAIDKRTNWSAMVNDCCGYFGSACLLPQQLILTGHPGLLHKVAGSDSTT